MWLTLPLDLIWRHQMGERRFNFINLISHTLFTPVVFFVFAMLAFINPSYVPHDREDHLDILAVFGFILLMWILGLANLWEIRCRRKKGIVWHTHYWGEPRFFLPDTRMVNELVIPLGSAGIAYTFYRLFPFMGVYLFIMAIGQYWYASDYYSGKAVAKLNRRDREINLEIKTAELEDRQRDPGEMVRLVAPPRLRRQPEQEAAFQARWQKVLKPADSEKDLTQCRRFSSGFRPRLVFQWSSRLPKG